MYSFWHTIAVFTGESNYYAISVAIVALFVARAFSLAIVKPKAEPPEDLPQWAQELKKLHADERNDDLYHFSLRDGRGVRILDYYWNKPKEELTGICWFGPDCESHRGLAHGGACTSVMDDMSGHIAFLSGKPWEGATVQVNVTLQAPIHIGSVLRVTGTVITEGRKRRCSAVIDDGEGKVFAKLEGLSLTGVRLTADEEHAHDEVATRAWRVNRGDMTVRAE
jgi:acyl-coenzyme A thioesterase PaaI-like protein